MSASESVDLPGRLNAVVESARARVEAYRTEAGSARQETEERSRKSLPIAERIVAIAGEKLEWLRERLKFDLTPAQVIGFPEHFGAATLEHQGPTYYIISDETRRDFAKRHGLSS